MSVLDVTKSFSMLSFKSNLYTLCLKLTKLTLFVKHFLKQIFMITHAFTEI